MDQPSPVPTRKVTVGAATGAASAILAWASGEFWGVELTPEIAIAISTLLSFIVSYLVPNAEP